MKRLYNKTSSPPVYADIVQSLSYWSRTSTDIEKLGLARLVLSQFFADDSLDKDRVQILDRIDSMIETTREKIY